MSDPCTALPPAPDLAPGARAPSVLDAPARPRRVSALRAVVRLLVVLQVAVPAVLFLARVDEPSRGQLPFGWQMHSSCWGAEPAC